MRLISTKFNTVTSHETAILYHKTLRNAYMPTMIFLYDASVLEFINTVKNLLKDLLMKNIKKENKIFWSYD